MDLSVSIFGALLIFGCSVSTPDVDSRTPDVGSDATILPSDSGISDVDSDFVHELVPSLKSRVKFKGGERFGRDLGRALSLNAGELCNELGQYNCLKVHQIVLGGMEPYRLGINRPLPKAGLTAPIATERVALAACAERARQDLSSRGSPVLFETPPPINAMPSLAWRAEVVDTLYRRLLSRTATEDEREAVAQLYDDIVAEQGGNSNAALRDWLTLGCFSVATTLEALFY